MRSISSGRYSGSGSAGSNDPRIRLSRSADAQASSAASSPYALDFSSVTYHGGAGIENQIDAGSYLFAIQPDGKDFRTRICRPVHMAKVISRRILTVLLKLQRTSRTRTQPFTESSPNRCTGERKSKRSGDCLRGGPVNARCHWSVSAASNARCPCESPSGTVATPITPSPKDKK
jgi:hypothetical protein